MSSGAVQMPCDCLGSHARAERPGQLDLPLVPCNSKFVLRRTEKQAEDGDDEVRVDQTTYNISF